MCVMRASLEEIARSNATAAVSAMLAKECATAMTAGMGLSALNEAVLVMWLGLETVRAMDCAMRILKYALASLAGADWHAVCRIARVLLIAMEEACVLL